MAGADPRAFARLAGSDCYLETANARAKPLYERLGFEVLSTQRLLPGGPVHWRMRRGARPQA